MAGPEPTAARERLPGPARSVLGELVRAAAVGAASGGRSTAGVTALALTSSVADLGPAARLGAPAGRFVTCLLACGEAVADTLPATPSRTGAPGLVPRVALAPAAATAVALRDGRVPGPGVAAEAQVAAGAALAAAFAGAHGRAALSRRLGSDLPGALAEDALVGVLAWYGTRRRAAFGDGAAGRAR
ncbi:hypothetical protein [Pseudonocardia ailaonensis]|uniref:hypothetical protein n=1 Tax=Pseudonocardia ailaonensis TaxID=367279 RepID=UPI0031D44068